jgi:hypothetical protein
MRDLWGLVLSGFGTYGLDLCDLVPTGLTWSRVELWLLDMWDLVPSGVMALSQVNFGHVGHGPKWIWYLWVLIPSFGFGTCGSLFQVDLGPMGPGAKVQWDFDPSGFGTCGTWSQVYNYETCDLV